MQGLFLVLKKRGLVGVFFTTRFSNFDAGGDFGIEFRQMSDSEGQDWNLRGSGQFSRVWHSVGDCSANGRGPLSCCSFQ
jgi:hypothetical protein